jgi:hypothetical protein
MATEKDLLVSRIFCRAVLPVIKVMLEDDPKTRSKFAKVRATIQFVARDPAGDVGAYLDFDNGAFTVGQGVAARADITFRFSTVAKMNAMFAGKPVLPRIQGITKVGLLIKVLGLLMGLKILMPNAKPKTPLQARLKVKMTLYMVSTALSQLNKGGYPDMVEWTAKQPERIYQWSVDGEDIACYLRVKAGKSQAGRGLYTRRKPIVHMKFKSVNDALPVLTNQIDTLQAMKTGLVTNDGSPEYGAQIGDLMLKVAVLVT